MQHCIQSLLTNVFHFIEDKNEQAKTRGECD
jgi:hypothetical protein